MYFSGEETDVHIQTLGCSCSVKLDSACCCISAATPSGWLAVMVTMPSDVTSPNFSSGGSHGRSALPRPEPLCRQNGNRRHLCVRVCVCLKSHTAPFSCHYLFMQQWILSITFSDFLNNARSTVHTRTFGETEQLLMEEEGRKKQKDINNLRA